MAMVGEEPEVKKWASAKLCGECGRGRDKPLKGHGELLGL